MKNFLRAVRHCLPYRFRLVLSVICAACAAALWGLAFTPVQPVLKILGTNENLQTWIDKKIADTQTYIDTNQKEIGKQHDKENEAFELEPGKRRDQLEREATRDLARLKAGWNRHAPICIAISSPASTSTSISPWARLSPWCGSSCSSSRRLHSRGFSSLGKKRSSASVVNLSLFDLRNRFFRNVVHLDIDQFNNQGTSELMARFTMTWNSSGRARRSSLAASSANRYG